MTDRTLPPADPLEGREVALLNSMLTVLHPKAQQGDPEAIDRVIKILDLKRKYREDRRQGEPEWQL